MSDIASQNTDVQKNIKISRPYCIFVCIGSMAIGGLFGLTQGWLGMIFAATGGIVAALFWLFCLSKMKNKSAFARFIGGIIIGVFVGILDGLWLHTSAWKLGFEEWSQKEFGAGTFHFALKHGIEFGAWAGGIYGLLCIAIFQVVHAEELTKKRMHHG